MYRQMIQGLIESCSNAARAGVTDYEIRNRVLREQIERLLDGLDAQSFLDWIREDREYSYYYFDVQQSGACAKPREAAALILEAIAVDNIQEAAR
ncbi:MAG TPA: hypothetical protein VFO63_02790 [Blastocatellia bacterium]|nr:hypothetical protein [Blastocatellia bacterium]